MERWLLLSLGFAFVGCGGDASGSSGGGGGAPSGAPTSKESFLDGYRSAVCDHIAPCCTAIGLTYQAGACAASFDEELRKQFVADVARDGVVFDATAAGECLVVLRRIVDACHGTSQDLEAYSTTCKRVLTGMLGEGAPCESSVQCASPPGGDAYCAPAPGGGSAGRTCQVELDAFGGPSRAAGEPCNGTCHTYPDGSSECGSTGSAGTGGGTGGPVASGTCRVEEGLYCDSATSKCVALLVAGAPCSVSDVCAAGAYCKCAGGTGCFEGGGVCSPREPAGASCTSNETCAEGAGCDFDAQLCVTLKSDGEACTEDGQCASRRCSSGACRPEGNIASEDLCGGSGPSDGSGTGP
jgi:hypothetical protein